MLWRGVARGGGGGCSPPPRVRGWGRELSGLSNATLLPSAPPATRGRIESRGCTPQLGLVFAGDKVGSGGGVAGPTSGRPLHWQVAVTERLSPGARCCTAAAAVPSTEPSGRTTLTVNVSE